MAKLTTVDISNISGNPTSAETNINNNFALVETAIENTLSRDGSTPNSMGAQLDMNSNKIINGKAATNATDIPILSQITSQTFATQVGQSGNFLKTDGTDTSWYDIFADLASTANAKGASFIGVEDSAANFTATTVETILTEIADDYLLDTTDVFTGNLDIVGTMGVGLARTEGTLHVQTSSAGDVGATITDLIIEHGAPDGGLQFLGPNNSTSYITFSSPSLDGAAEIYYTYSTGRLIIETDNPTGDIVFATEEGDVAMHLDVNQHLGLIDSFVFRSDVGGTRSRFLMDSGSASDAEATMSIIRNSNDASGPRFNLGKSRTLGSGGVAIVSDNDILGTISFYGADGGDLVNPAATIVAEVDGTPGSNDMPGALVFSVNAGSTTVTEAMRIASTGAIAISSTLDGRDIAADGTKLDTIETSATADQTAAEILTALLTVDGTGSLLDADLLDGIELAALLLNTTDTFTGNLDIVGTAGVGLARTDGTLHVHTGSAGTVTSDSNASDLVVEGSGVGVGISILAKDNRTSFFAFGAPSDNFGAQLQWNHNAGAFRIGSHKIGAYLQLDSGNGIEAMRIDSSGNVVIGNATAAGKLDVDQASASGAIPVLYLDQADVSEEFIRFDAVAGTGNSVEVVGAKSLTTTHFLRININGTDYYLQAGTIA